MLSYHIVCISLLFWQTKNHIYIYLINDTTSTSFKKNPTSLAKFVLIQNMWKSPDRCTWQCAIIHQLWTIQCLLNSRFLLWILVLGCTTSSSQVIPRLSKNHDKILLGGNVLFSGQKKSCPYSKNGLNKKKVSRQKNVRTTKKYVVTVYLFEVSMLLAFCLKLLCYWPEAPDNCSVIFRLIWKKKLLKYL